MQNDTVKLKIVQIDEMVCALYGLTPEEMKGNGVRSCFLQILSSVRFTTGNLHFLNDHFSAESQVLETILSFGETRTHFPRSLINRAIGSSHEI